MSARQNIRDFVGRIVPSWLSEGDDDNPGFGYRLLWVLGLIIDGFIEAVSSAFEAARARGASSDADIVGDSRGLIRNQDESDEDYARRLATWVDRARENGGPLRLGLAIHDYLRTHPRVHVFRRSDGQCIAISEDRTITRYPLTAFDWDSQSHPERNVYYAPWWSDMWIVVFTNSTQWQRRFGTLDGMPDGDDGFGLDHYCTYKERDDLKSLIRTCKSAHSCIRALIWCSDNTKFNPANDASMPNGRWGDWGIRDGSSYGPSDRDYVNCVFWEPR